MSCIREGNCLNLPLHLKHPLTPLIVSASKTYMALDAGQMLYNRLPAMESASIAGNSSKYLSIFLLLRNMTNVTIILDLHLNLYQHNDSNTFNTAFNTFPPVVAQRLAIRSSKKLCLSLCNCLKGHIHVQTSVVRVGELGAGRALSKSCGDV